MYVVFEADIRDLGNAAAYGDNIEFKEKEFKQAIKFVDLIIEYIYILLEKIEQLENRK